jgi:hypothetical protein
LRGAASPSRSSLRMAAIFQASRMGSTSMDLWSVWPGNPGFCYIRRAGRRGGPGPDRRKTAPAAGFRRIIDSNILTNCCDRAAVEAAQIESESIIAKRKNQFPFLN